MDAMVDKAELTETTGDDIKRPTRAEAEAAVRTLISWAGDDPARGLFDGIMNAHRIMRKIERAGMDRIDLCPTVRLDADLIVIKPHGA